jgi:6-phosphofructokinase 1
MSQQKSLAILVGGGPAPGINSVISSATIRAVLEGVEVTGIRDGFEWIMKGNIEHISPLTIEEVSRIHFRGGSYIGISRANPTRDPQHLENTVISLLRLNVSRLITIGGDDTAYSAMKLVEKAEGRIRVVHVPKTIDNDLDLPAHVDTFGYQTARHYGVEIVKNLMVDARTTSRWYFIVAMGRKTGHLALGIGKAAGASLTLIPEEFLGHQIRFKAIVDTLVGAILKRLSYGRRDGVAVIAEGLVEGLDPSELQGLQDVERDTHGNVRIAEVNIGEILKAAVQQRLKEFGIKTTVVAKNIGYELRCADPIPFDLEYTRDLGYCATKCLLSGGHSVMISMQGGHFVPIPFEDLINPLTGRAKIRMVDIHSTRYAIARRYMLRLRRDDFEDPHELAKFAATAGMSLADFRKEFGYLIEWELPPLVFGSEPEGGVPERHGVVIGLDPAP